ncbi:MAG: hypothetical protein PHZ00_04995 [Candidatus Peribacteraceae bacterium]|nr:hypothetical protein [Candidatus Peribacteraceae bacterium]
MNTPDHNEDSPTPAPAETQKKTPRKPDALQDKKSVEATLPGRMHADRLGDVEAHQGQCECCVDGRCTHEILGTFGGSLGMMAAGLTALWKQRNKQSIPFSEVQKFVDAYPGILYLHTDKHGEHDLKAAVGDHSHKEGAYQPKWHNDVSDNQAIDQLIQHLGCGHIKKMLAFPEQYGTDKQLITDMLKAVIIRQKSKPDSVKKEVLEEADHKEKVVFRIKMKGGIQDENSPVATFKPCKDGVQGFVVHEGLPAYLFRTKVLPALKAAGIEIAEADFLAAYKVQADQTTGRLAGGLGVFDIEVEINDLQAEPKVLSVEDEGTVQAIAA